MQQHPRLRIPQPHRRVLASGGEPAAVRADRHAEDVAGMAAEGLDYLGRSRIPDLDRVPFTPRNQVTAVRAEREAIAEAYDWQRDGQGVFLLRPQPRRIPELH